MPVPLMEIAQVILMGMRLVVFGLALGLTLISFQAYQQRPTDRLETAFIGFAFLSMGVALTALRSQAGEWVTVFELVESIPLIIGFGMLYVSLYR